MNVNVNNIKSICSKYSNHEDFYFFGHIPDQKIFNAKLSLGIPHDDDIFLLVDLTVFGSAKDSFCITSSGVYHKYTFDKVEYDWDQLSKVDILEVKDGAFSAFIRFSDGRKMGFISGPVSWVAPLLRDIIVELRSGGRHSLASPKTRGSDKPRETGNISAFVKHRKANILNKQDRNADVDSSTDLVDINNAGLEDLVALPGITKKLADIIIEKRNQIDGFSSTEEALSCLKLQPHMEKNLKRMIYCGEYIRPLGGPRKRVIDF